MYLRNVRSPIGKTTPVYECILLDISLFMFMFHSALLIISVNSNARWNAAFGRMCPSSLILSLCLFHRFLGLVIWIFMIPIDILYISIGITHIHITRPKHLWFVRGENYKCHKQESTYIAKISEKNISTSSLYEIVRPNLRRNGEIAKTN